MKKIIALLTVVSFVFVCTNAIADEFGKASGSGGVSVMGEQAEDSGWGSPILSWKDENGNVHYTNDPAMIPSKYRDGNSSGKATQPKAVPSGKTSSPVVATPARDMPKKELAGPYVLHTKVLQVIDSNTLLLATGDQIRIIGCSQESGQNGRAAMSYLNMTVAKKPPRPNTRGRAGRFCEVVSAESLPA